MDEENDSKSNENNSDLSNEQVCIDLEVEENNKEEKIIEIPESEYLALKKEVEKYKKVADENFSKLQRAQADFDNYKKILDKQKIEYLNYAEKGILLKILDIIDEYEIALNALKKEIGEGKEIEGMEIIYNKFIEMLQKEEVKPIKSLGEKFDPFIHECLLSEATDEYPEDTVLEEIKKGYYFKDKVLRPALVKIAKNKERK
ncbi:MAG: nucleotide exchange factor GrpE [Candidatus Helarchaeota archaeon]|nr:nucleotide exchange factor GrpE [Candidatus Helarchaeota archaeon]